MAGVLYAHSVRSDAISGHLGVQLFFTISGFLITGMLLDARGEGERGEARPLRYFYIRRILRLWPAYYAIVSIALWRNWEDIRASAPWHLLYATNIYFYVRDTYDPWILDHFWSLGVEEQYYLFWPFVVYFCDRRLLLWIIPALGILSWLGCWIADPFGWNGQEIGVDALLPFSLNNLSAGGLLALWYRTGSRALDYVKPLGWIGLAAWITIAALAGVHSLWTIPCEALVFVAVVHSAAQGSTGIAGRLLASAPLRYCGMVSYGIYLYHAFVIMALGNGWLFGRPFGTGWSMLALTTLLSIIAATLSWYMFELPINRLKRYFPFPGTGVRTQGTMGARHGDQPLRL